MTLLTTRTIDPAERGAWLRLICTRRVGPHSFWSLLHRFETAQAALAALPELSRQGGAKQPLQTLHEPKTVKTGAQPLTKLADDDVRAARDSLLKCLGPTPCSIDELFRECQVPARLGAAALVELELGSTVERTAGNLVCRLI